MSRRPLPNKLQNPIRLRKEDSEYYGPGRTVLTGRHDCLDVPRINAEVWQNILSLFEHYDINTSGPAAWRNLAIALACDWVPGCRTVKVGRSRLSNTDLATDAELIDAVLQSRTRPASLRSAATSASKKTGKSWETLRKNYRKARE